MIILHSDELQIREHEYFVRNGGDLIVGEVHLGDGDAVPPTLVVEVQLVDAEQVGRELVGLLPHVVEGARLQGSLYDVEEGLLLYHFFESLEGAII